MRLPSRAGLRCIALPVGGLPRRPNSSCPVSPATPTSTFIFLVSDRNLLVALFGKANCGGAILFERRHNLNIPGFKLQVLLSIHLGVGRWFRRRSLWFKEVPGKRLSIAAFSFHLRQGRFPIILPLSNPVIGHTLRPFLKMGINYRVHILNRAQAS